MIYFHGFMLLVASLCFFTTVPFLSGIFGLMALQELFSCYDEGDDDDFDDGDDTAKGTT